MGGMLNRVMPARAQAQPAKCIADLDLLVPQPYTFRLGGRQYSIAPATVRKLAQLGQALEGVLDLLARKAAGEAVDDKLLYEGYHRYLSILVPDLSLHVVESMTYLQLRRLLTEIIRYSTGQQARDDSDTESEKKKTMTSSPSG